jgi:ATP-binding cassette, subfamily B, bacterial
MQPVCNPAIGSLSHRVTMNGNHDLSPHSLRHELRIIAQQGKHLWQLVPWRHRLAFAGAGLIMAITSACNIAVPVLLGQLLDKVKAGTEQAMSAMSLYRVAILYLGFIAAAYFTRELLQVARRYMVENSCTRLEKRLTLQLVSHLMRVDLAALTHEKVGALQGRISRSVVGSVRFIRLAMLDFFPPLLTGLFALIAALSKEPWLALVMVGVIPVSILLTIWQIFSQKNIRLRLMRSRENMEGTVVELLGGLDYVRVANTHMKEVERIARVAENRRGVENRHHFQMSWFGCAKALNEGLFHILVLALAIYFAVHGEISFGDILTFSMLFLNVMAPLNEVHRGLDEGHECSLQVSDLLDMLAEPEDRSFLPNDSKEPKLQNGGSLLVIEDLHVEYPASDSKRKTALNGVSLTIRHGETIGVAGRSGCGKTTWLRVLMRLIHPVGGRVMLGNVPLASVSRESIGKLIGYVGQHPFVFAGSIAENIAYGVEGATREAIIHAARGANIHDEITAMPGGYDAEVAERGQNLSGGQRQRVALARIFLKNPPILVLDEGTSALDTISERQIQHAIDAARADRTTILVAHRLSTLRAADRIMVFDSGRIIETGTFSELLNQGGVFTELAK